MSVDEYSWVVASDVDRRDGIGLEVYRSGRLVMEIFRDDAARTRTVTFFGEPLPLEVVEASIRRFREEIPWEFVE
ncbi:MAG: hypothetical protein Kow006_11870 [Gammaproteobacteria bacterium]